MIRNFNIFSLLLLCTVVGCSKKIEVSGLNPALQNSGSIVVDATKVCTGTVIAGVTGTANCSGGGGGGVSVSVAEGFYVLASRKDVGDFDWSDTDILDDLVAGINAYDRSPEILTLKSFVDSSNASVLALFNSKYQAVPNPVTETDGLCGNDPGDPLSSACGTEGAESISKKHYLERITGRPTVDCGRNADVIPHALISDRIADCASKNVNASYYNAVQYGQGGEGDWKLVTKVGAKEVWQDQRTQLLWSDVADNYYNWYQASGYSQVTIDSQRDTYYDSAPSDLNTDCNGFPCQPSSPISVCAEVENDKILAGGGHPTANYAPNPENAFKGNLKASDGVVWKLPSRDDWMLAEVNGIRKAAPNWVVPSLNHPYGEDYHVFWSSSSSSYYRRSAWYFYGYGNLGVGYRYNELSVRCVGFAPSVIP